MWPTSGHLKKTVDEKPHRKGIINDRNHLSEKWGQTFRLGIFKQFPFRNFEVIPVPEFLSNFGPKILEEYLTARSGDLMLFDAVLLNEVADFFEDEALALSAKREGIIIICNHQALIIR